MEYVDLRAHYQAKREVIRTRIQSVLDHGQYAAGPEVDELEAKLAAYTGARHCITVASGTEALVIALTALGVGAGHEVITTPFSRMATADAVVLLGATPVFVDIDPATCNIDPGQVEARITARTRAIMPVSLYGQPADMDEINAIARRRGLPVVEDAAQSFGASYRKRRSCNLSTIGCTSFFPSNPLGCYGNGGALFTNDDGLAQAIGAIREQGRLSAGERSGAEARMDSLQCAVVLARLERFEWELGQRQRAAAVYDSILSGRVQLVGRHRDRTSALAEYAVALEERERIQAELQAAGIPTAVHYPVPLHVQPAYAHLAVPGSCPVAVAMADKVLSLPMSHYIDAGRVQHVAEALLRAARVPVPAADEAAAARF